MKRPLLLVGILVCVLLACIITLALRPSGASQSSLTLYCAAGLQAPMREIATEYEQHSGTKIQLVFNGSGALLSQLQLGQGDLYLPANQRYIDLAAPYLSDAATPIVQQNAVIVTHQSNTTIHALDDLGHVKLSFADDSAAIGHYAKKRLEEVGLWETIRPNIVVYKPTVNGVIEDVAIGAADATIAWEHTARNFKDIKIIEIDQLKASEQYAAIAALKSSRQPQAAADFIHYLRHHPDSVRIFQKYHFDMATALP